MSPRCVDCRLLNLAVCAIPTVIFSTFFCFRRRWRCKCSHCESLGFLITNDGLRVDWAHQTCNLHVRRSTKRLREAEENREELLRICSSDSCSVLFCYKRNEMFVFGVRCLVNLSHKMHAHTLNCLPALCARALSVLRNAHCALQPPLQRNVLWESLHVQVHRCNIVDLQLHTSSVYNYV